MSGLLLTPIVFLVTAVVLAPLARRLRMGAVPGHCGHSAPGAHSAARRRLSDLPDTPLLPGPRDGAAAVQDWRANHSTMS